MNTERNAGPHSVVTSPAYILRSIVSSVLLMFGVIARFVPELFTDIDADIGAMAGANWLLLIVAGLALGFWNIAVLMKAVRQRNI